MLSFSCFWVCLYWNQDRNSIRNKVYYKSKQLPLNRANCLSRICREWERTTSYSSCGHTGRNKTMSGKTAWRPFNYLPKQFAQQRSASWVYYCWTRCRKLPHFLIIPSECVYLTEAHRIKQCLSFHCEASQVCEEFLPPQDTAVMVFVHGN